MRNGLISYVEPGSAAFEGGIVPGDSLLSINGHKVKDIFDYRFYAAEDFVALEILGEDGEIYTVDIEKEDDEDLGIEFENPMIDEDRGCCNKCIFCFIDQMPCGMRDTLYFKDDDTRLSFLTGNYVTLTNVGYNELRRIVKYRMSPINVSVHTTNPELRCLMLGHKGAGDILQKLDVLRKGCITVNAQIVLCPDFNDKLELERTLKDLSEMSDCVASVSVVPVGLTKYRDDLTKLRSFTKEESAEVIRTVTEWQKRMRSKTGRGFVYASDEFYLKSGIDIPSYDSYDDYPQLENGVGMLRLLDFEVCDYLNSDPGVRERYIDVQRNVSIATGAAAFGLMNSLASYIMGIFKNVHINVFCIDNVFFGPDVTVAGLITGRDLISQLRGRNLGDTVLITENMLRAGEHVFLDDVTLEDAEKELGVAVRTVPDSGKAFVDSILGGI